MYEINSEIRIRQPFRSQPARSLPGCRPVEDVMPSVSQDISVNYFGFFNSFFGRVRSWILPTVISLVFVGLPSLTECADGQLDPTFGSDALGRSIVYFEQGDDLSDVATALAVDPSTGEIFVGGTVSYSGATSPGYGIAKLSPGGSAVGGWGNIGLGRLSGVVAGRELKPLAVTLDGFGAPGLVGGAAPSGTGDRRIFALHADAAGASASTVLQSLPLSGGGTAEPFVSDVMVDDAGRSLVCGVTDVSGGTVGFVARLTAAGGLDSAFGTAGSGWVSLSIIDPAQGATWCEGVEVDREGRVLVLLRGLNYSTLQAFGGVQRRTSNGAAVDATFGASGLVILNVRPDNEFELLTDLVASDYGDIYVVGYAQGPVASSMAAIFRHISPDGSSVTPFEFYVLPPPTHSYTRFELTRAVVDPAGRVVAGGTFVKGGGIAEHHMAVVRFSSPFTLDSSFGTGGFSFVSFTDIPLFIRERTDLEDMIVTPDGRLLLAGRALYDVSGNNYDFALARLESAALFFGGFETGDGGRWSGSSP